MARTMSPRSGPSMPSARLSFPEMVVALVIVSAIGYGIYYYFVVYRSSPGYVVNTFFNQVNAGHANAQYDMLTDQDKRYWPTEKKYDDQQSNPLVRGYTERISATDTQAPVINPSRPDIVKVPTTLSILSGLNASITTATSSVPVQVTVALHKDSKGEWLIWLGGSDLKKLLAQPPNPPSSNF